MSSSPANTVALGLPLAISLLTLLGSIVDSCARAGGNLLLHWTAAPAPDALAFDFWVDVVIVSTHCSQVWPICSK
jgi:hypothetical protein